MSGPSDRPRVALIAGPTASGKSALALELAEREGGTIINADAAQVYRDLRVLTARPTPEEEARVPHMLFGHRDAASPFSAAEWAVEAKAAIATTLAEGRLPIVVGGTGLYLGTLIDGIAPVPPIDAATRAAVRALPAAEARAALEREDPAAAIRLHPHDSGRIARALEVIRSTGRSLVEWQEQREGGLAETVRFDITVIDPPVAELYARSDARLKTMVAAGALDEVVTLRARSLDPALPAMRSIGVREFSRYLDGDISLANAIEAAAQATRNYAKRQRTWLRHQLVI